MFEDIGNRRRIEAGVVGIQNSPDQRHRQRTFQCFRNVGRNQRNRVALADTTPQTAIERAIKATADWSTLPPDAYLQGEAVMRLENRIPFRGWRMSSYTTYASVREKVNGVLALEVMGPSQMYVAPS